MNKIKESTNFEKPSPLFKDEISIVFATDDNYAPCLGGGGIQSLIENASENNNYVIYILDGGISPVNKTRMLSLEIKNVKIKFIDMSLYTKNINIKNFYISGYFSFASYFRLFIPEIFSNFDKILYLDSDGILLDDPAKLYNTDLEGNFIGATQDIGLLSINVPYENMYKYIKNTLKLKNPCKYFQSGVLLMDIKKLLEFNFFDRCIQKIKEIKKPKYLDQCILNSVCYGSVKFLDPSWNVENHCFSFDKQLSNLKNDLAGQFQEAKKHPKFLHYTSGLKPWNTPSVMNGELYFNYARKTPFYEELIYRYSKIDTKKEFAKIYNNFFERLFSYKIIITPRRGFRLLTILGIKITLPYNIRETNTLDCD